MNTNASLGSLVYAVIEHYGDLARTAVASAVGRRQAACGSGKAPYCAIVGHLFSEHELSMQHLQPGNWLSVGLVGDGTEHVVVEINLTTEEMRERLVPPALIDWTGDVFPDMPAPPHESASPLDTNTWDVA